MKNKKLVFLPCLLCAALLTSCVSSPVPAPSSSPESSSSASTSTTPSSATSTTTGSETSTAPTGPTRPDGGIRPGTSASTTVATRPSERRPNVVFDPDNRPKNPGSPTKPDDAERKSKKFYVDAVYGNDDNDGSSLNKSVKTLARAQELVRAVAQSVNNHVTVYIRGGEYILRSALVFDGAKDSLPGGKTITYKNYDNETVYISGGFELRDWTVTEQDSQIVKAFMPEGAMTRDLYVNGKPAVRARTAATVSSLMEWDGSRALKYFDGGRLGKAAASGDVEVVFKYQWNTHRAIIKSGVADGNQSILTLDDVAHRILTGMPWGPEKTEDIWYLENSMEFLDEPGEWYYDKAEKTIYYMLRRGESADTLNAYAGISEQLITSTGETALKNITFEGLTFCDTTWLRPQRMGGYATRQSAFFVSMLDNTIGDDPEQWQRPEAAIRLFQTDGVKFINNRFVNLGGCAIDMVRAKNARISGNLFTNCGGSAIVLAGFGPKEYHSPENSSILTENCEISNNYIHDICTNMHSASGIAVGYSKNIDILNNTIHDLPYTGISYGWGWGVNDFDRTPASSGGRIAGNHIYKVAKEIIDGGAIYTLSRRDGLVIESNYIHDNRLWNGGIYLDNRSAGYTIRYNVLENNPRNFCLNSYNTKIYDNYLDKLVQSEFGNDDVNNSDKVNVYFLGFLDAEGNITNQMNATTLTNLGLKEWSTLGNSYTAPSGDTKAKANAIKQAAGVKAEYKAWFGMK